MGLTDCRRDSTHSGDWELGCFNQSIHSLKGLSEVGSLVLVRKIADGASVFFHVAFDNGKRCRGSEIPCPFILHPVDRRLLVLLVMDSIAGTVLPLPTTMALTLNTIQTKPSHYSPSSPLLVLVHGLDSSSKTWEATMDQLSKLKETTEIPCLAVDQRGCGYSPLGNPDAFSQTALEQDLHAAICRCQADLQLSEADSKVILLGHSLGGRIAMGYAARYPERLAACIIEDMDIAEREPSANGLVQLSEYPGVFDRQGSTQEGVVQALKTAGYPDSFLERALRQGRIERHRQLQPVEPNACWWSHINPDFRKFCYPHILSTGQSRTDCHTIKKQQDTFPCHILVAGREGTVCVEESVQEMKTILGDRATIHRYPTAGHSIHSTAALEFIDTLRAIIVQNVNY
jgi:pimeloyl-ACP methyl ester carboxylesterase